MEVASQEYTPPQVPWLPVWINTGAACWGEEVTKKDTGAQRPQTSTGGKASSPQDTRLCLSPNGYGGYDGEDDDDDDDDQILLAFRHDDNDVHD